MNVSVAEDHVPEAKVIMVETYGKDLAKVIRFTVPEYPGRKSRRHICPVTDFMRDANRDIPLQTKHSHCFPASRLPEHHGWQHYRDSQPRNQVCPGKTMNIQVTDNLVHCELSS